MGISKPVVFISHSVYDKNIALILKNNIADYIRGSLEIFVSSDSQSLRVGRDGLKRSKIF